jgi:anti-sigma regulatory factor (Ser/Thr protein kinase)
MFMASYAWLTADIVEQLHGAALRGKSVSNFVNGLTDATMTGLIEYGCLRRSFPEFPSLPQSISNSSLGQSLATVVSDIGIRTSGTRSPISNSHRPQEMEFVTIDGEDKAISEAMGMLYMRFTQASKAAGFATQTANELQAAFNEMIENAVQHSEAPIPVLAGYHVHSQIAQFVVADVGCGVLSSLKENSDYAGIKNDAEAIRLALHDGVSRFAERGGFGFRPVFKALTAAWGALRFRSGHGCLMMDGTALDADHGTLHFPPELPGFQVSITCRLNQKPLDMPLI